MPLSLLRRLNSNSLLILCTHNFFHSNKESTVNCWKLSLFYNAFFLSFYNRFVSKNDLVFVKKLCFHWVMLFRGVVWRQGGQLLTPGRPRLFGCLPLAFRCLMQEKTSQGWAVGTSVGPFSYSWQKGAVQELGSFQYIFNIRTRFWEFLYKKRTCEIKIRLL